MNYDDSESKFYLQGIKEYEKRRQAYNQWLYTRIQEDKTLFVSTLYGLQYIPEISLKSTGTDRIRSLINHYFDGMDFKNPLLIKTSFLNKWMDAYVNLYGQLSTTEASRDSLFPLAGKTAIEKARKGHPLVYGWMVDYFYRGYESNDISSGMKVLETYMKDSNCLTLKRQEISKRLKGIETMLTGSLAPNIIMNDLEGNLFDLNKFETQSNYILVIFWLAGCSHCMELINNLYPWVQQQDIRQKIKVIAISLDEEETEKKAWEQKIKELKGWQHLRAAEGVRSKTASDYYILSTPVMVLLDAKTKEIVAVPNTLNELMTATK
jgi:thiol-disulfide isomerase/thioredoxin